MEVLFIMQEVNGLGVFEDAQRRNIEKQLKSGNITQAKANEARAGVDSAARTGGTYTGRSSAGGRGSSTYSETSYGSSRSPVDTYVNGRPAGTSEGMIVPGNWYERLTESGGGGHGNAAQSTSPLETQLDPLEAQAEPYDPNEYINQLKQAQLQSRIAALDKARTGALSALDTEKANVAPAYYDKRNQAAAASDVGAMNFAQYMAARGIKGAAGAMPEVYRQAGLQGQIGALDRQEAANLAAIENQKANINTGYESDVAAANADVEAQALQNYINQMNADRAYQLQQAQLTGSLGDTRTLAGQEFDYSKSPSNPEVQYRILANKQMELSNAAQEIKNSYLPETLKLEAQQLVQKVNAGQYDADTALAQLNQIKAQTANYNRLASGGGSSGGLTTSQELSSQKAMNDWVTKQVENDSRLLPDYSNYQQLYDAWKNMYVQNMYGG